MSEPLIPRKEAQPINHRQFQDHIQNEGKWEVFDGFLFGSEQNDQGRIQALLLLLYNVGLERLLQVLPNQSLQELKSLIVEMNL